MKRAMYISLIAITGFLAASCSTKDNTTTNSDLDSTAVETIPATDSAAVAVDTVAAVSDSATIKRDSAGTAVPK